MMLLWKVWHTHCQFLQSKVIPRIRNQASHFQKVPQKTKLNFNKMRELLFEFKRRKEWFKLPSYPEPTEHRQKVRYYNRSMEQGSQKQMRLHRWLLGRRRRGREEKEEGSLASYTSSPPSLPQSWAIPLQTPVCSSQRTLKSTQPATSSEHHPDDSTSVCGCSTVLSNAMCWNFTSIFHPCFC